VNSQPARFRKSRVLAIIAVIILASFIALVAVYPLGIQAVILGGTKDVWVYSGGKPVSGAVQVYASNETVYCFPGIVELRNSGIAGLPYTLGVSLRPSAGLEFLEVRANGSMVLGFGPGLNYSGSLRLEPGSSVKLDLCLKAGRQGSFTLTFVDPRYESATRSVVTFSYVLVDWWNNSFTKRITLTPIVSREGLAIFEITADGTVYVNGKPVRKVSSLEGIEADGLAVVLKSAGARYLVPFQVESWAKRSDGVLFPASIKSGREQMWGYDRLVFSAYITNGSRIEIYLGGRLTANFTGGVEVRGDTVVFGSERATLNEWGFFGEGWGVNLSGYIVYPYQARRIEYSDAGAWRLLVSGPVRTVFWFNTSGFSDYRIESAVAFWGRGINATQMYVWPSVDYRGIVLEWASPIIYMGKSWTMSLDCGTTCGSLPVKVVPGNKTRIQLCQDFFTPGGARYGYFHIVLVKAPLAEIKSVAVSFSSFPGG